MVDNCNIECYYRNCSNNDIKKILECFKWLKLVILATQTDIGDYTCYWGGTKIKLRQGMIKRLIAIIIILIVLFVGSNLRVGLFTIRNMRLCRKAQKQELNKIMKADTTIESN